MVTPKELILRPKPAALSEFDLTRSHPTQIIACPNPPIAAVKAGHAIAVKNEFEIAEVLNQLPTDFKPDLVSLSARVMSFLPRGLKQLDCPTVMKLGDTFHLGDGGLSRMIQYCQHLECDYHWTYQSVQHLHFFVEAGLRNVFWLPASIVVDSYIPNSTKKSYDVIFRGATSELHYYRNNVLNQLQAAEINIDIQTKPYLDCLQDYAKSHISINCSLNGDLNRRVFEVIMAGGFLLSDRISPQTGLFELFEAGVHFDTYHNGADLIEKIHFYLAHPEKAQEIAIAGQQRFLDFYQQQNIKQKLYRYIFKHDIDPLFCLMHDRRHAIPTRVQAQFIASPSPSNSTPNNSSTHSLSTRIKLYELIQELHRLHPSLSALYWQGCDRSLLADLADLPRLHLVYTHDASELTALDRWCTETGIRSQVHLQSQSNLPQFQIGLLDQTHFDRHHLQAIDSYLLDRGFLIVVGLPDLITTWRLSNWLRDRDYVPVELSINLFQQRYPLSIVGQGLVYQKITSNRENLASSLIVVQKTPGKVLQDQIKLLPIFNPLRRVRNWLRRSTCDRS